jgi:hypothetical protein
MPNTDIDSLKHDIDMLKGWITHWAEDSKARLPITESSIGHALMVIDRAKGSLARIEAAEQREIAA